MILLSALTTSSVSNSMLEHRRRAEIEQGVILVDVIVEQGRRGAADASWGSLRHW